VSNLVLCDGPGCNETRPPGDGYTIRLGDLPWIQVIVGTPSRSLDFHNQTCLAKWSRRESPDRPEDQPCTCTSPHQPTHTKGDHRAYPAGEGR